MGLLTFIPLRLYVREQPVKRANALVIAAALVDRLVKKRLQRRVFFDGQIEHRVAAFNVRPDAHQIAVALVSRQQLFKPLNLAVMSMWDQLGHGAADGGFDVYRRIMARFSKAARQNDMPVEDRTR